jgi:SAM-dependent methyltransferase
MTAGPGVITADGCPVDLYAALPPAGEAEIVAEALPPPGDVLELGAGAGRITRQLLARGYDVTAVDQSSEMLDHIAGAERVCARIEGLDLGRRFDAVVLASHLINTPDDEQRHAFAAACARHVGGEGVVLIERHPLSWFASAVGTSARLGDIEVELHHVNRPDRRHLSATVTYRLGEREWAHPFVARALDDDEIVSLLAAHRLRIDRYLDEAAGWLCARRT